MDKAWRVVPVWQDRYRPIMTYVRDYAHPLIMRSSPAQLASFLG